MSKIINGGLDQYGAGPLKQQQFGTAGVGGVNNGSLLVLELCNKIGIVFTQEHQLPSHDLDEIINFNSDLLGFARSAMDDKIAIWFLRWQIIWHPTRVSKCEIKSPFKVLYEDAVIRTGALLQSEICLLAPLAVMCLTLSRHVRKTRKFFFKICRPCNRKICGKNMRK